MKVLLVYPGYIVREQPLNILYISSAVKEAGHQTKLFEITPITHLAPSFLRAIREFFIDFGYKMKRFLPGKGFFLRTR